MMNYIADGVDLAGYSVADTVVGKAVAMLFVKCKVIAVYAKTMSKSGKAVLESNNIFYEYETLTDRIINRAGTDACPMEKAVLNTDDAEEAYVILQETLKRLSAK